MDEHQPDARELAYAFAEQAREQQQRERQISALEALAVSTKNIVTTLDRLVNVVRDLERATHKK